MLDAPHSRSVSPQHDDTPTQDISYPSMRTTIDGPVIHDDLFSAPVTALDKHTRWATVKYIILRVFWTTVCVTVFWSIVIGLPLYNGYLPFMWNNTDNMDRSQNNGYQIGLKTAFCFIAIAEAALNLSALLFVHRDYNVVPKPRDRIALVIPAHNACGVLEKTIQHAQKYFLPHEIFVLSNSNNPVCTDGTIELCERLGVNGLHVPYGNKACSQYLASQIVPYEYLLLIDDDTLLGDNMSFPIEDTPKALAYMIQAGSHDKTPNLLQKYQHVEFSMAGLSKAFESQIGSVQFAHGALQMVRRDVLAEVFNILPSWKMSEDALFGYLLTRMGVQLKMVTSNFAMCDSPEILMPRPKWWKNNRRESGFGSASLWNQRVHRWYATVLPQLLIMMRSILLDWKLKWYRCLGLKIVQLWVIIYSLLSVVKWSVFIFYWIHDWSFSLGLIGSLEVMGILMLAYMNVRHLQKYERCSWFAICTFTLQRFCDSVMFTLAMLYAIPMTLPQMLSMTYDPFPQQQMIQNILADMQSRRAELIEQVRDEVETEEAELMIHYEQQYQSQHHSSFPYLTVDPTSRLYMISEVNPIVSPASMSPSMAVSPYHQQPSVVSRTRDSLSYVVSPHSIVRMQQHVERMRRHVEPSVVPHTADSSLVHTAPYGYRLPSSNNVYTPRTPIKSQSSTPISSRRGSLRRSFMMPEFQLNGLTIHIDADQPGECIPVTVLTDNWVGTTGAVSHVLPQIEQNKIQPTHTPYMPNRYIDNVIQQLKETEQMFIDIQDDISQSHKLEVTRGPNRYLDEAAKHLRETEELFQEIKNDIANSRKLEPNLPTTHHVPNRYQQCDSKENILYRSPLTPIVRRKLVINT